MGLIIASLKKTVAAAGTEVALAATKTLARNIKIKALHGNTNMIYVGANGVSSTTGYVLDAGEVLDLSGLEASGADEYFDLNTIYIDSDTNGEGVTVSYVTGD